MCAPGALALALLCVCATGCDLASWEKPVSVTGDAPEPDHLGVATEALASSLKGVYVVSLDPNGALCDNAPHVTHAAALQQCINTANTDGGGIVLVQAGTYSSGTWPLTMKSKVTLMGAGHLAAKLAPAGNPLQTIFPVEDNTAILGIAFDHTNVSQAAITIGALSGGPHVDIRLENNAFTSTANSPLNTTRGIFSGSGISNSYNGVTIRGNWFQYGSANIILRPIWMETNGQRMDNVRIEGNTIVGPSAGTNSAYVTLLAQNTSTPSRGVIVTGNTMRTGGTVTTGIEVKDAYGALITGNAVQATNAIVISADIASPCGASIIGNDLGGQVSVGNCGSNSVVAGNSQNTASAGVGKAGVAVRAYRNGSQTFTAGTDAVLAFNTEDADYGNNFDPATGTFLAPTAGLYRARACARINATNFAAGDTADITLRVNSANAALNRSVSGGTSSFSGCVDDILVLSSGAPVQAIINASGTANTRTVAGTGKYSTFFSIERISD
jgi:hypothetical protein